MLGLSSLPAVATAKEKCWILETEDGAVSAGELRLRVMSSSGKTDYLLNGARVVQLDDGVIQFSQSFPVTGGAVNMGPSAQVTLTETGASNGSTWVTHWHLVVSSEDLNGTASAITTLVDDAGIGPSVAVYAAVSAECISSNMS